MGLLDDIAKSHTTRRRDTDERVEAEKKAAAEKAVREAEALRKREEKRAAFEAGIQRGGPKPWAHDPRQSVAGLHVGGTFEFVNAEELDGRYVVVQIRVPKTPSDPPAVLWAARDDGQPPKGPFIEIDAAVVREELALGRLNIIRALPLGAAPVPPPAPTPLAPMAQAPKAAPEAPSITAADDKRYSAADAFGGKAPKKAPERPLLHRFDDDDR